MELLTVIYCIHLFGIMKLFRVKNLNLFNLGWQDIHAMALLFLSSADMYIVVFVQLVSRALLT